MPEPPAPARRTGIRLPPRAGRGKEEAMTPAPDAPPIPAALLLQMEPGPGHDAPSALRKAPAGG